MTRRFTDHVSAIEARLQPALLDATGIDALHALCDLLPFDTASSFGFETRLDVPVPRCDFFLQIFHGEPGIDMLAGASAVADLDPTLLRDPEWRRVRSLFQLWRDPDSLPALAVEQMWLEFDRSQQAYTHLPNLFFRITGGDRLRILPADRLRMVLDAVYTALYDTPFPAHLAASLDACIAALPNPSHLYQVGLMLPRGLEAIRFVIVRMEPARMRQYLRDIAWPDDIDAVMSRFHHLSQPFNYVVYNITIGTGVLPYLGMECYFTGLQQPTSGGGWAAAFTHLMEEGLCDASKQDALIAWCGKQQTHGFVPQLYINGLNHVKLAHWHGRPLEAKAYFGTMIRPIDFFTRVAAAQSDSR